MKTDIRFCYIFCALCLKSGKMWRCSAIKNSGVFMKKIITLFLCLAFIPSVGYSQKILIPMDLTQTDHLKAYGVAYWILERNINVEWLLNYRGGSFLLPFNELIERELRIRGVHYEMTDGPAAINLYATIENNNMEVILLEKAPRIAIYQPPNFQPWDDAVALALNYAEIKYDRIWDKEVLEGKLDQYDWLHLHHEDFTGQYGKFFASYGRDRWYIDQQRLFEEEAEKLGFKKVSELKKSVVLLIRDYVTRGGFLFAMCSATDTFDITLAAQNIDIVDVPFDGDPPDPDYRNKLDYTQCFAFTDFMLIPDPMIYEYSDIDVPPSNAPVLRGADVDYFTLFEFSAKYDPVPTMLTQSHVSVIKGFMGQTTSFKRSLIKRNIINMGESQDTDMVKYIHGNFGKGTFTFFAGHDPEDYTHAVGDPPTQLTLHKNSPGYRLILNNVLFPAAKKKPLKTD